MWKFTLILYLYYCNIVRGYYRDNVIGLTIPQGSLIGLEKKTEYHNVTYYSFKGIPYAKPRRGVNKFDPPEPAEPWEGILNATEHREMCTQFNQVFTSLEGSEDCLYLNIYTRSFRDGQCKPVMVWIHAGAFNLGNGHVDFYGPDFLIEYDIVMVTFNYRLGPLGFLCTGDKYAPGNMGLKDQVYALRWIRDNIKYFGGCPDQITLSGSNAGAISAQYHMFSPMSRGLFHRVIIQSGSLTDFWAINTHPYESTVKLAKAVGISGNNSEELVSKLKNVTSNDLILAASKFYYIDESVPYIEFDYIPCIETRIDGEEMFMTDTPFNLLLHGDIADVPVLIGVTEDEGALGFTALVNYTELMKGTKISREIKEKFAVHHNLYINDPAVRSKRYEQIHEFYYGDLPDSEIPVKAMQDFVTDSFVAAQFQITSTIINERIKSNMYKYLFYYKSDEGYSRAFFPVGNVSTSGDEIEFLFYGDSFANIPEPNSNGEKMYHIMTKMWTNFVKFGDPTALMDDLINVKWKPAGEENNILYIDLQSEIKTTYLPERMSFWMKQFKHLLGKYVNKLL